ncbi:hypothetical protein KJ644_04885 [Candidatus Dependentiae bacterium]|nr:hypothetical protein [Candidatus Dependentiae bacterium]MBU4387769.1 hypothetical protein [Candidatus Dependentiae bacterium]MCG2755950.1 hypothetical protein [Candidatus Dependentiae bacterium]
MKNLKVIILLLTVSIVTEKQALTKQQKTKSPKPISIEKDKTVFKLVNDNYVPLNKSEKQKQKTELITIFVHGTIIPYPSVSNAIKTMRGDKKSPLKHETFWHKYINNLRFQGFYQYQPIDDLGLIKINLEKTKNLNIHENISHEITNIFSNNYKALKKDYKKYSYYTFGWCGRLDAQRRLESAEQFYKELIKEIEKLKTKKIVPEIQIYAHSHGGNVALNLANIEKKQNKNLKIKKLVLFGTPVQKETSDCIGSNVFEKIYSFYSKGDDVQVADFISTKKHKSNRKFYTKEKPLPNKLVQVEVKCDKLKPRHSELWITKTRANLMYRDRLCISPYPVLIFEPSITNQIENNFKDCNNIKVNIRKTKKPNSFDVSIKDFQKKHLDKKHYTINIPANNLNKV